MIKKADFDFDAFNVKDGGAGDAVAGAHVRHHVPAALRVTVVPPARAEAVVPASAA